MGGGLSEACPWFFSGLSELRDGGLTGAEVMKYWTLELHSRAIEGSAKVCWVVDINRDHYLIPDFLSILDCELRGVNAVQASLSDWMETGRRTVVYSIWKSCRDYIFSRSFEEPSEPSIESYAVVVSAVVLLSLVYQYLTGNVDRGGSKAYTRRSLDFRDIYVAIVLFLGAYVWIKFREVAFKGVLPRKLVDKVGRITKVVYEPRFKPPRENGRVFQWLYLGQYATPEEASILYQIAAFYYNKNHGGLLDLEDGRWFSIPPMSEEERSLAGAEKRAWVKVQATKVYEDFRKEKAEAAKLSHELLEAWEDQGLALSNGHILGSQGGSALPVSQLPPNTESGMRLNGSDQLILLETRVGTQQQQISLQQQQISDQQQQISLQHQQISDQQQQIYLQQRQIQELGAQMLQFQNQQRIQQQQQLQESRIQNPQWSYELYVQEQHLQDVNQGVPGFEMDMEQRVHQPNYPGLMAPPPDGGEGQEAF